VVASVLGHSQTHLKQPRSTGSAVSASPALSRHGTRALTLEVLSRLSWRLVGPGVEPAAQGRAGALLARGRDEQVQGQRQLSTPRASA